MGNQYYTNKTTIYDEMIGQVFGRLTVLAVIKGKAPSFTAFLACQCICGNRCRPTATSIKHGRVQSCGCYQRERVKETHTTHGESNPRTPEFSAWWGMRSRCNNPNHPKYYMYGARGIKVCQRWLDSFENFLADMGRRPSPKHSLDRYPDKNGNYELSNCRWATPKEQQRNTRLNNLITWNGKTQCLADWCTELGIPDSTLGLRLKNWPLERAMTEPIHTECHNKNR